jgi:hypothetical protein
MPDTKDAGSYQLEPGSILRQGDVLYIVERGPSPSGDVVVGTLGEREVRPKYMFELGDDCPIPTCNGTVVEGKTAQRRHCSEGCLEWLRNVVADGDECGEYHCDGEAIISIRDGKYEKKCSDCSIHGWGQVRWREAWWPNAKRETLDHLRSRAGSGETPDIENTDSDTP